MLMCDATGLSQRRACRLTGLSLSTCRYEAHRPAADAHLSGRITELALERRRFGYRRIWQLLRREGLHVRVPYHLRGLPLAGARDVPGPSQTVRGQTVAARRDQTTPVSAFSLHLYGCRYSTSWQKACGDADRAYKRGERSLQVPEDTPAWRRLRWPSGGAPPRSQNQHPELSAIKKRVLVNSAGE